MGVLIESTSISFICRKQQSPKVPLWPLPDPGPLSPLPKSRWSSFTLLTPNEILLTFNLFEIHWTDCFLVYKRCKSFIRKIQQCLLSLQVFAKKLIDVSCRQKISLIKLVRIYLTPVAHF